MDDEITVEPYENGEIDHISFDAETGMSFEDLFAEKSCWSKGPLSVCADLEASGNVVVTVKLAGIQIAKGTLTADRPCLKASAKAGVAKVELRVCADFTAKEVRVTGKLCILKFPSGWNCAKFNARIISW